jgi:hypothetical protein
MTTLNLWVDEQPWDFDATADYIAAVRFTPEPGVTLDGCVLSGGDAEQVFAEFRRLAKRVAEAGHGDDTEGNPIPGEPILTACPVEVIEAGYRCAAESLARLTCHECDTFAQWRAGFGRE